MLLAGSLLLGGLGGCVSPERRTLPAPLTFARHEGTSGRPVRDRTLLVFLPGRGTSGRDFVRQGFVRTLPSGAAVDSITTDLTFPYYLQRTATRRLHEDVIAPARAAGYRRIWLVGCSVGGMGAIFYDHEHPGIISGIVAIAPYLGEKDVAAEIEAAGGLDRWQPKPKDIAGDDFRRELWVAIRRGRYGQPGRLPLVLAHGTKDRFVDGQRLLAAQLPPGRVFTTFGFHDWGTWGKLWREILASPVSPLAQPLGS